MMLKQPIDKYRRIQAAVAQEQSIIEGQIDRLLELSPDKQRERIDRSPKNLRSPSAVQELLRRSQDQRFLDHGEAFRLAQLALLVAGRISGRDPRIGCDQISVDYRALALAHMANARRIGSHWSESYRLMRQAFTLHTQGSGDIDLYARLCSLRASLLKDRRRHEDALVDLHAARTIYRQLGNKRRLIEALLKTVLVHSLLEEYEFAYRVNNDALRLIDEWEDPHLALIGHCNEALCLTELGRPHDALRSLRLAPNLDDIGIKSDSTHQAYLDWEFGKAKLAIGYYRGARELLERARTSFEEKQIPFKQALVTLDLARLYFKAHKTDKAVYRSAYEAVCLLRSQQLDREAWQAVQLLARAVAENVLTLTKIRQCIRVLRGGPRRVYDSCLVC
ncbi:MAG: hypothetical protein AAGD01_05380 [Acidobacteriota bacterium]